MAYQFSDKQTLAVWTANGSQLAARTFDGGVSFWLTQVLTGGSGPAQFIVRGRNMLIRGDVTMQSGINQSVYTDLAGGDTGTGGLDVPTSFQTPSGYTKKSFNDGGIYYEQNGTAECVLENGLVVGNMNGHNLEAFFNSGKWYVVEVVQENPRRIIPRGKNVLSSGYATVTRPNCIDAFNSETTLKGGLDMPGSFTTPSGGWQGYTYPDQTVYFEKLSVTGGTLIPEIQVTNLTARYPDNKYVVTKDTVVTLISRNYSSNVKWFKTIGAGTANKVDVPLNLTTPNISTTGLDNCDVYMVNLDANGNTLAISTSLSFVSEAAKEQTLAPGVDKGQVPLGQAIILTLPCDAASVSISINDSAQILGVITLAYGVKRLEYLPSNPQYASAFQDNPPAVGMKLNFYATCPGKTMSVGTQVVLTDPPANPCDAISDGVVVGVWNASNSVLKARLFNSKLWLTQVVGNFGEAEQFVVRSPNMLGRADVTSTFKGCSGKFSGADSDVGGNFPGLAQPSDFPATLTAYDRLTTSDGTVYWKLKNSGNGVDLPVPQIKSALSAATNSVIQGFAAAAGTVKVYKGGEYLTDISNVVGDFSYTPTAAGTYTFALQSGDKLSNKSSGVVISGTTTGGTGGTCSFNDRQQIGTTSDGKKIYARVFGGKVYQTVEVGTNPEKFVVRGDNFILRDDVTSTYKGCKSSFGGGDTGVGTGYPGFPIPANFATPTGYTKKTFSDTTPYFEATGTTTGTGGTDPVTGTDTSANPTGTKTAVFSPDFGSSCGNPIEFAVSKAISDPKNSTLKWQSSIKFTLETGTYWFHCRETGTSGSTQKDMTVQEQCTV